MQSHRRDDDDEERRQAEASLFLRQRSVDDGVLEKVIDLFEKRAHRTLSKEDARQIVENLSGFFQVLAEWDRAERSRQVEPSDTRKEADDS